MYNKKLIHLVPQILIDRSGQMLDENTNLVDIAARENIAQQLETVRDYCTDALMKYEKARKKATV